MYIKRIELKHYFFIQQIFQTVNRARALYLEKYYFIHSQIISLLACDRILKESCCSINYLRWKKNENPPYTIYLARYLIKNQIIETEELLLYIRKIIYDWKTKARHLHNTLLF